MFGLDDLSSVVWGFGACAAVSILFPRAFGVVQGVARRGIEFARTGIMRARKE